MTPLTIHFAPMQGLVDNAYRRAHYALEGGVDCYYTPFIRIERGEPRRQDIKRIADSVDDSTPLVPQIIFNSPDEFTTLVNAVKDIGFRRIDLNLGCPYPMQTRRGRGAALIAHTDSLERVAPLIDADTDTRFSVKMRLGLDDPQQWRAPLDILNALSLEHIAVHPRIAPQLYDGPTFDDQFAQLLDLSKNPVIWNADITEPSHIDRITERFPAIAGVMIGRGLIARPSLAREWRNGEVLVPEQRLQRVIELHDRVLAQYRQSLCGQTQILQKIKPFWEYSEPLIGHRAAKQLRKASSLDRYTTIVDSLIP